jgi:hypothetical protein
MLNRKTVLVVGMLNSVHLARWVDQFAAEPIDFVMVPSTPTKIVHPLILQRQRNPSPQGARYQVVSKTFLHSKAIWVVDRLLGLGIRGRSLARVLKQFEADFIHVLEFQNAGYLLLSALEYVSKPNAQIIATNYGSDIYWFQQFPRHLRRIRRLLSVADRYSAECQRDVYLATKYGFKGRVLPVIPNAGGFPSQEFEHLSEETKSRKNIMIKGYDGWVGRARFALAALAGMENDLRDYEITVYSADRSTLKRVKELQDKTELNITAFKKNSMSHSEMMAKFRSAKIYIGISLSDGISTSLLEALVSGAVPIQTYSACTDGWFTDGIDGVILKDLEVPSVIRSIKSGLEIADQYDQEKMFGSQSRLKSKLLNANIFQLAKNFYED